VTYNKRACPRTSHDARKHKVPGVHSFPRLQPRSAAGKRAGTDGDAIEATGTILEMNGNDISTAQLLAVEYKVLYRPARHGTCLSVLEERSVAELRVKSPLGFSTPVDCREHCKSVLERRITSNVVTWHDHEQWGRR